MRLLVIEDDEKIRSLVSTGLEQENFIVDVAPDGELGVQAMESQPYDLVVLDLMLPKMSGLDVMKTMRERQWKVPVIILSAKRTLDDRLEGLRQGGDDYLVKPFSFQELLVRIQAILRRTQSHVDNSPILQMQDVTLNLFTRDVSRDGIRIELQSREFVLLELFMRNPGRALSKSFILEKVWNYHFDPQTNVVDVLIFRLRTKIDRGHETRLIHTVRGIGYLFGKN